MDEVARFWSSFRTSRDLALVGLMLLQGLRSQEVLDLNRDDMPCNVCTSSFDQKSQNIASFLLTRSPSLMPNSVYR